MTEPIHNLQFVCDDHAPKPDPRWAEKPLPFFVGKFVKKSFPAIHPHTEKLTLEHMWVSVHSVTADGLLVGTLNNEPVFEMELANGDTVTVDPKDIQAVFGDSREKP